MRLFVLSSNPPMPSWGTSMAFHRHLVERDDFQISVATDNLQVLEFPVRYPLVLLRSHRLLARLQRTRAGLWAHAWQHLVSGRRLDPRVLAAAQAFKPQIVLSSVSSWSWTNEMAWRLADRLRLPLVASFNDWFSYNLLAPPCLIKRVECRFRAFYRRADLALCTSEGMREALGPHGNAQILYPLGAAARQEPSGLQLASSASKPFSVLFAGNIGEWYGPMLEQLVSLWRQSGNCVSFRIFGSNPSWTHEFDSWSRREGIFRGQVPFDTLQGEAASANLLLVPMGFDPSVEIVERTSFKTKFMDYVSFQKPIVVWGPTYCSAVRIAQKFDSALCCTTPNPRDCLDSIHKLALDPARQLILVQNARRMYQDRFNPEQIHRVLVDHCQDLVSGSNGNVARRNAAA